MSKTTDKLREAGITVEAPVYKDDNDFDIQKVSENADLSRLASDEAFMNEFVTIRLATTTDPNAPPSCVITVNNAANCVVIPRGIPRVVKRLHVEVLARMKETRSYQPKRDMEFPESGNTVYGNTAMVYPFEVLKDDNPKGRAWLENILAEPA